ncbi:hypothetical protein DL96DRAFT_1812589 [Flagelloscypha sp. PMI_526]|nr:hypothetical protein DL96DRAFT_1812589 [Flagelloscypha sp. PMI_526]
MHTQQFQSNLKRIGGVYTPYSQFKTVASCSGESDLDCEVGKFANALVNRSNMTMAAVLAILAYFTQASTPDKTSITINTFVTLLVLCLCLLNRACFNDVPVDVFKKRVKSLTAIGATVLYTLPEIYILLFIMAEGYHLIGLAALFSIPALVILHVVLVILLDVN